MGIAFTLCRRPDLIWGAPCGVQRSGSSSGSSSSSGQKHVAVALASTSCPMLELLLHVPCHSSSSSSRTGYATETRGQGNRAMKTGKVNGSDWGCVSSCSPCCWSLSLPRAQRSQILQPVTPRPVMSPHYQWPASNSASWIERLCRPCLTPSEFQGYGGLISAVWVDSDLKNLKNDFLH